MSCHVLCFLWRAGRSCLSSVKPRRMGRPNGSRSPYAPPPARPQSGGKDGGCELSHLTGAGRLAALSDCFCFPFRFFFLASAPPSRPPTLPQKAFFVVVALALLTMLQGTEARRGKGKRDDGGWEGDFCIEYPRQVPLVPGRWTGTVTPHRICARTVDAAQRSPGDQGQRHPRRYFIFFLSFFGCPMPCLRPLAGCGLLLLYELFCVLTLVLQRTRDNEGGDKRMSGCPRHERKERGNKKQRLDGVSR